MANTYVSILFHLVFSTKRREPIITPEIETALYKYIWGIVANYGSRCYIINGTEDHTHMLVSLSKTTVVSEFVGQVKSSSTRFINSERLLDSSAFGWQDGYGAFSVSASNAPAVARYIDRQKEHHRRRTFEDEYRALLRKAGIEFDERYLFD